MTRVLITGGTGYLGSRLAQYLAGMVEYQVSIAARRLPQTTDWIAGDVFDTIDWQDAMMLSRLCEGKDVILHCAGLNEKECAENPVRALEVNAINTQRLVDAAISSGVKQFIYISTAHVYGSPLVGSIDENTLPNPVHPYASSHRAAEDIVLGAHARQALQGIILRLSNGFGCPAHADIARWSLIVNDLCRQAVRDKKLVLRSFGEQHRDFITLEDLCQAIVYIIGHAAAFDMGLYNLGSEESNSIYEMADMIARRGQAVLGYTPEITRLPSGHTAFSDRIHYDCRRIRAAGVVIKNNKTKSIDETLEFCKRHYQ